MAVEGTLDLFKLPEILQLVAQQKKTGILTVQGQHDIVAISFLNGRIVAADALNQAMEEGLARVLASEGIMKPQDLTRAHAEHQEAGGRLLDLLVERGYVERTRLLDALRLQTRGLVEQLLRWDEGDFKFYSGEEVSYEDAFVPISVEEVLLHAAELEVATGWRPEAPSGQRPEAPPAQRPGMSAGPRPVAVSGASGPRAAPIVPLPSIPAPEPPPRPRLVPAPAPTAPAPAGAARRAAPVPAAEPAPTPFRKMKVETVAVPSSYRLAARLLAVLPAALLAAVLTRVPDLLVLPFPWQEGQRAALARAQRAALFLKIDRAAKTHYLLEGSFPDRLVRLADAGLLSPRDLVDPQGQPLAYRAGLTRYSVEPLDDRGAPLPGADATEAVTGNFLLDSELTSTSPDSRVPLVLLD